MMRGNPESLMVNNPQEVDIGRRNLLVQATRLAGAGAATYALSKAEPAYAAVKKIAEFRDRREVRHSTNLPSLDTHVTTPSKSQGQSVNIQDTPTPDATVTALQKRILQDQANQLETPPSGWLEANIATLIGFAGTAATIGVGIWQFNKTLSNDRKNQADQHATDEANRQAQERERLNNLRIDRERRDEDRFQTIVSGMGRTGAAIMLQTFLDPKYKESYQRFYQQIFNLSVAHLRLREVDPNNPQPDSLHQALIRVFKDSVPLMIELLNLDATATKPNLDAEITLMYTPYRFLDARGVKLDGSDFFASILKYIYLSGASLTQANLQGTNLERAHLNGANLAHASLHGANLERAALNGANLTGTDLTWARFKDADLSEADLTGANPENDFCIWCRCINGLTAYRQQPLRSL
jgi:uncharacterized protein YjbI with pentapeptide repeats